MTKVLPRTAMACFPGDGSVRGGILRLLEQEKQPLSAGKIATAMGRNAKTIDHHLRDLEDQGRIVKAGRGKFAVVDPVGINYPRVELIHIATEIVRRAYVQFGFERVLETEILIDTSIDDGGRHVAACEETGKKILLSPRLATFPEGTRLAIVGHEFGHAADFLYPGKWLDDGFGKPDLAKWKKRDGDEVERTADQIAEAALGIPIRYGSACLLQTIDPDQQGIRPRPVGLR